MPKLLIIAGAGASFDSDSARPVFLPNGQLNTTDFEKRLPLANGLFVPEFLPLQAEYWRMQPLVADLVRRIGDRTVEEVLTDFQSTVNSNPIRPIQLMATRFYIPALVRQQERVWLGKHGITSNWMTLFNRLADLGIDLRGDMSILTMNYDTLIERALEFFSIPKYEHISHYHQRERPLLVKAHGSVNWFHQINGWYPSDRLRSETGFPHAMIEDAAQVDPFEMITFSHSLHTAYMENERFYLPALAVPVRAKINFVCPPAHREALIKAVQQASHVLIVGWRGADDHVTKLIKEHISPSACITVVTPKKQESVEAFLAVSKPTGDAAYMHEYCQITEHGFSDFLHSSAFDDFKKRLLYRNTSH